MRRIAIINQKGGVGKTTTTVNLGAALARTGRRVLLIDLDPQSHLTLHLGIDPSARPGGIYEILTQSVPLDRVRKHVAKNLWVVGSHIDLAAAEVELVSVVGREVILRDVLDAHKAHYDYVLMDCPPSLGVLTLNALAAANEIFIPLQPHYLALHGLSKLLETVSLVARRINPPLRVTGVIVCMHEAGTRLASEVLEDVSSFLNASEQGNNPWAGARIFKTLIRRNIKLAECPSHGMTIFDYAPQSHGSEDYAALAVEVRAMTEPDAAGPAAAAEHTGTTGNVSTPAAPPPAAAPPCASAPVAKAARAGNNGSRPAKGVVATAPGNANGNPRPARRAVEKPAAGPPAPAPAKPRPAKATPASSAGACGTAGNSVEPATGPEPVRPSPKPPPPPPPRKRKAPAPARLSVEPNQETVTVTAPVVAIEASSAPPRPPLSQTG